MNLTKLTSYLLYGLSIISVVIFVLYFFNVIDEGAFLGTAYVFFGVAAISAVGFPIIYLIMNPKKAKGSLVGVGALLVVMFIAYLLADSTIPSFVGSQEFNITEGLSKMVDASIISLYILALITIVAIIYIEISKLFK